MKSAKTQSKYDARPMMIQLPGQCFRNFVFRYSFAIAARPLIPCANVSGQGVSLVDSWAKFFYILPMYSSVSELNDFVLRFNIMFI